MDRDRLAAVIAGHYFIERWSGGEATCTCRQWVESVQRKPYTTWAQHVADAILEATPCPTCGWTGPQVQYLGTERIEIRHPEGPHRPDWLLVPNHTVRSEGGS